MPIRIEKRKPQHTLCVGGGGWWLCFGWCARACWRSESGVRRSLRTLYRTMFLRTSDNRHRGSPEGEYPPRVIPSTKRNIVSNTLYCKILLPTSKIRKSLVDCQTKDLSRVNLIQTWVDWIFI